MEKLLIHTVWNQTADFSTKFRRRPRAEPSPNTGVDNCCYCQNHARTGGAPTTITIIESRTEAMKMRGLRVHLFLLLCDKNPTANSPRKQRGEREKETNQMAVVSGSSWCPGLLPRDSDLTQVPRRESSEAGGLEDSGSSSNSHRPSPFHNWNYWNDLALGDLCRSGCPGLLVNSVGREREGDPELGTGGAKRKKRVFLVPTVCTWEIAYNSRAFALIIRVQKSGRLSPIQIINHNFSYSMLEFSKVFILMYSKKNGKILLMWISIPQLWWCLRWIYRILDIVWTCALPWRCQRLSTETYPTGPWSCRTHCKPMTCKGCYRWAMTVTDYSITF